MTGTSCRAEITTSITGTPRATAFRRGTLRFIGMARRPLHGSYDDDRRAASAAGPGALPMHWKLLVALVLAPALATAAGPAPDGRWQGVVEIPGRPLSLTLDLAADAAGQWQGSVTMPALGVAGVPLRNVVVADGRVTFSLTGSLDSSRFGTASVEARLDSPTALAGRFSQA